MLSLSICTAAYNELQNLEKFIFSYNEIVKKYEESLRFELIICDDASTDESLSFLRECAQGRDDIKIFENFYNMGAGYSFNKSIQLATLDYILTIDSDNQYSLTNVLESFLNVYDESSDFFLGQRNFKSLGLSRGLGPTLTKLTYQFLFTRQLKDFSCVVKIFKTSLLNTFKLEAKGMNYSNELTVKLWLSSKKFRSFNVTMSDRKAGYSKTKFFRDAKNRLFFTIYLIYRTRLINKGIIHDN